MKNRNESVDVTNEVILSSTQELQRLPLQFINNLRGRYPAGRPFKYGMTALFNNSGFTLIELLVVVLIIGILSAVAVPQYKKAAEKSKAQAVLSLFPSLIKAVDTYYLANGEYPTLFNQLNVEIPWTGNRGGYHHSLDQRSDKNWSLGLYNYSGGGYSGPLISFTRISGPYTGTRFAYSFKTRQLYCVEHTYGVSSIKTLEPGAYCVSIMGGLTPTVGGSDGRWYKLPQ